MDNNINYGEGRESWIPLPPAPPPSPYDKSEPLVTPYPGPLSGSVDYPKESNHRYQHYKKHSNGRKF